MVSDVCRCKALPENELQPLGADRVLVILVTERYMVLSVLVTWSVPLR